MEPVTKAQSKRRREREADRTIGVFNATRKALLTDFRARAKRSAQAAETCKPGSEYRAEIEACGRMHRAIIKAIEESKPPEIEGDSSE